MAPSGHALDKRFGFQQSAEETRQLVRSIVQHLGRGRQNKIGDVSITTVFPIVVAKRFLCGWIEVGEHYTGVNIAARKRRYDVRTTVNHLGINAKLFDKGFR